MPHTTFTKYATRVVDDIMRAHADRLVYRDKQRKPRFSPLQKRSLN